MARTRPALLLLLLAGCATGQGRAPVPDPVSGPRPVLEVLGVEPVEGGHRVHVRLSNPTLSTWCLRTRAHDPVLWVQAPGADEAGWRDMSNPMWCGTGILWTELAPGAGLESLTWVDAGLARARVSLPVVEGVMAPREGYHGLWPPMNQPEVWVHSAPIELAERQADR